MKLNKLVLTLAAAALLPAFACAETDAVAASFERDMHRESITSAVAATGTPDLFVVEFNTALNFNSALNGTTDPVLASFERDMYREPVNFAIAVEGEADVLAIEFYAALRDVLGKPAIHATAVDNRRSGS